MRRRPAVAGTWYPDQRQALIDALDSHLAGVRSSMPAAPRAIVAPHAGLPYSGPVAAHAYAAVRGHAYRAIVLVGPSHYDYFEGVAIWPSGVWDTPLGAVPVDEPLARAIADATPAVRERPSAHAREHSLEMQLPFLARLLAEVPIVPLVMGRQTRATAEELGRALASVVEAEEATTAPAARPAAGSPGVLLVASTDLSHYEDAATAAALDSVVLRHIEQMDADGLMAALEAEPAHACGGGPLVSVLHAARAIGASHSRVLEYADSGDVTGDKTSVVGYVAAAVWS